VCGGGELVLRREGGRVHVSEDVGDIEFHSEETCLGVIDEVIGRKPGWRGGEGDVRSKQLSRSFNMLTGFPQLTSVKTQQCPK
jgi:hypothetical protein